MGGYCDNTNMFVLAFLQNKHHPKNNGGESTGIDSCEIMMKKICQVLVIPLINLGGRRLVARDAFTQISTRVSGETGSFH
jgi:hypothetical protein